MSTTNQPVTRGKRTPVNTRQGEVEEPARKHTRRDTNGAVAVPAKLRQPFRSLTEADIPRIVDTFIEAQDKRHRRRQTRDSDAEDVCSEDDLSDSVNDLGDSADKLLTDEDLSSKDVHYAFMT